jgi:hypothetical protein
MISVSHILGNLFPEQNWKFSLLSKWETIVGNLKTRIVLEKINDDCIIVGVIDSSWMQELHMLSNVLIDRINNNLDSRRINHIRFKLLPTKKNQSPSVAQKNYSPEIVLATRPLSLREKKALEALDDVALRRSLENFLFRCLQESTK